MSQREEVLAFIQEALETIEAIQRREDSLHRYDQRTGGEAAKYYCVLRPDHDLALSGERNATACHTANRFQNFVPVLCPLLLPLNGRFSLQGDPWVCVWDETFAQNVLDKVSVRRAAGGK